MLRFDTTTSTPTAMWFSQHSFGEAFTYSAVEESPSSPLRPIAYSAKGTHANYAIAGTHDPTIPNENLPIGPLEDHTSQGTLWDPALNSYRYIYDIASDTFNSPNNDPTSWLYFEGQWGDDALSDSTPGQVDVFEEQKYTAGPTGPRDKQLGRSDVCPTSDTGICVVRDVVTV